MNNSPSLWELPEYTPILEKSRKFQPELAESACKPGIDEWNGLNRDISIAHRKSLYFLHVIYNLAESFLTEKLGADYDLPVDVRKLAEKCNFIIQTKDFTSLRRERNDRTFSPVAQLQMRSMMAGEDKGKIAGVINVADYLGETSIRFSIAHELAHYVLRKHNPIGLNYLHEACPGMYPLSDSDELLSDIFAYALLLPYSRFVTIKDEYEDDNSRWPIDFSNWIGYLRDKTQMPEYHVALAYHTIKQYAIARRVEAAHNNSINWLNNLIIYLTTIGLSKSEIKGLLSCQEAKGTAKEMQKHLSESIDLVQEKIRSKEVKGKVPEKDLPTLFGPVSEEDLLQEIEYENGFRCWKRNIMNKLFNLGMTEDELTEIAQHIGVKSNYVAHLMLDAVFCSNADTD